MPADTDIIICVDLDERIMVNWRQALMNLDPKINIFNFYRRDVTKNYVGQYVPMLRIFRNNGKTKWYYPVHETLGDINTGINVDCPNIPIYVEHYEDNNSTK